MLKPNASGYDPGPSALCVRYDRPVFRAAPRGDPRPSVGLRVSRCSNALHFREKGMA